MTILLVEDDAHIAAFVTKGLREDSWQVDHTASGREGLAFSKSREHDVIILDLMLPDLDGVTVCRQIRAAGVHTPVLMLTARNRVADKVGGLASGADDYLTKPFAYEELLARVHALARRRRSEIVTLEYGPLRMEVHAHRVFCGGEEIALRPKEYALLHYLLASRGRVLSRTQILENVWGYHHEPGTNVVDVYVSALRAKLNSLLGENLIRTVRGVGYMVEA